MKIQFKRQQFQADAAAAVVRVFQGQPKSDALYNVDPGKADASSLLRSDIVGYGNFRPVPELTDQRVLRQLNDVQRENGISLSPKLERSGRLRAGYNLTIEMETGVGKTYAYIKTIYELRKAYGWSKFIIVVPSIAVREGVYKTFEITQDHFVEEYGERIDYFIYNSEQLSQISGFATSSGIKAMIINAQAFNARGEKARRINMELDEFQSRRPIDVIAQTNPILIIDEPQSVEGSSTKERLAAFSPFLTLRYSATHRPDSVYNMVYRLDALDAYRKKLVKKIAVVGISQTGSDSRSGYVYLEKINVAPHKNPTATLEFEVKGKNRILKKTFVVDEGTNLFEKSGELEEYRDQYEVVAIDGRSNSIRFANGITLRAGFTVGKVEEKDLRRLQIRETIKRHLERERELYSRGIKVLSLFFIDEVRNYRIYGENGPENGVYAQIFEEEYERAVENFQHEFGDAGYYSDYLSKIAKEETHAGYFAQDKHGKITDKVGKDEVDAYDLIMKNKELLLERDPLKSPVRFIFSHSALREGWDNPNVFQICALKESGSDVRRRQEVGRGLRLCVDQSGRRMDSSVLEEDEIQRVNLLTIVASESYDAFTKGLQAEISESLRSRPRAVTAALFAGQEVLDDENVPRTITKEEASQIYFSLVKNDYIDAQGNLTDAYCQARTCGSVAVPECARGYSKAFLRILESVSQNIEIENARRPCVELKTTSKINQPEFKELWDRINRKSTYLVDFDTEEFVKGAVAELDRSLRVASTSFKIERGELDAFDSKESLLDGSAFSLKERERKSAIKSAKELRLRSAAKYDLIGKIVEGTGLTRRTAADILRRMNPTKFELFKINPEEFILQAVKLINDQKATVIVEHIKYRPTNDRYAMNVFTDATLRGYPGKDGNVIEAKRHVYDYVLCDSQIEKEFSRSLEDSAEVAVYAKLPKSFYIATPVGRYSPDWAIVLTRDGERHVFFVAETKGHNDTLQLRGVENAKIHCAKEHFKAIGDGNVQFDTVVNLDDLFKAIESSPAP